MSEFFLNRGAPVQHNLNLLTGKPVPHAKTLRGWPLISSIASLSLSLAFAAGCGETPREHSFNDVDKSERMSEDELHANPLNHANANPAIKTRSAADKLSRNQVE